MENSKHSLGLLIDIVSNENDGFRRNNFNFDDFADDLDFINDNLDEETESYPRTDRVEHVAESQASDTTEETVTSQSWNSSTAKKTDKGEQEFESIEFNTSDEASRNEHSSDISKADEIEHEFESFVSNDTDETSRNEHPSHIDKTDEFDSPILIAEKVESPNDRISEVETMEISPATLAAEKAKGVENVEADSSEHSIRKKSVSFDLPFMEEYSDNFDTEDEESESIGNKKAYSSDPGSSDGDRNSEVSDLEEKSKDDVVNICTNCNCRMTTLRLVDLPELDSLFVSKRGKRNKKCKHDSESDSAIKRRTNVKKYQPGTDYSSDGKVKSSKAEGRKQLLSSGPTDNNKKRGDKKNKHKEREPLDDSWGEKSNASLLQWLKNKNKEAKEKRRQERKIKKEEKRTKKLEELEKLCKKNLSDRLVDDWMRSKKKEQRLARKMSGNKKVSPLQCEIDEVINGDNGPKGYTVLDTFKKLPSRKTSGDTQSKVEDLNASGQNKVQKKKSMSCKDAGSSHQGSAESKASNLDRDGQLKARKSYDEWLCEKRSVRNKKPVLKNSWVKSDDDELLKKERIRRYKEKQNSKIKVDSSLKKTDSKVAPKSTKIKERSKGYQWRSKELKLAQRPDPQGCDNPDSHLSSMSPDSELADNDGPQSEHVSDSMTEEAIETEAKGKGLLLEYLTEDNRAWMTDKSSEKKIEAAKSSRPKTAHPRMRVE